MAGKGPGEVPVVLKLSHDLRGSGGVGRTGMVRRECQGVLAPEERKGVWGEQEWKTQAPPINRVDVPSQPTWGEVRAP